MPVKHAISEIGAKVTLISTGQQRELLDLTMKDLDLVAEINLDLMESNPTKTSLLASAMRALTEIFNTNQFDYVVVQGDTFTALAGAMVGYLHQIPVGHVEAGLRSGDLNSPWPEEGIRRMIDGIATHLWVPTANDVCTISADQNLRVTGNTVVDSLRLLISTEINHGDGSEQVVVTLHRRESFGATLLSALIKLKELSMDFPQYKFLFIQHPNPAVYDAIYESGLQNSRVTILDPLPYSDFMNLLNNAKLLITDSGGLQEEAHVLGVPMIVLRDKTERIGAISPGLSTLSNPDGSNLHSDFERLISVGHLKKRNSTFGDGYAAEIIAQDIAQYLLESK
jgi:UDP-N-acetylglucosamine 2-epimerase (non-hydrolysing)